MANSRNRIKSKSELGITRVKDSFRADFQRQGRQTRLGIQSGENSKRENYKFFKYRESLNNTWIVKILGLVVGMYTNL